MGKTSNAKETPLPSPKRRSAPSDSFKQEKARQGRSKAACDRCKAKKVKCDGEGLQTCSICQEGDFHCNYAQKALCEKTQYRKGYVEMVEETNEYYKTGLHKLYELFQDDKLFAELHEKYSRAGQQPTAQEIVRASGAISSDKVSESGVDAIKEHLAAEKRPILVRHGEWDRVQAPDQPLSPTDTASSSNSPLIRSTTALAASDSQPVAAASPDPLETDTTPTSTLLQVSRPSHLPSVPAAVGPQRARAGSTTSPCRRLSAAATTSRGAYTRPNPFQGRAGSGRARTPAYTIGSEGRSSRHALSTGQTLRHAPYPSPASLSPVYPRAASFGDVNSGNTVAQHAAPDASFDPDYEPAQPTICPAELELGGSCPPSRTSSLIDPSYEDGSVLQAGATFVGADGGGVGSDGASSDMYMAGLDEYGAALVAATTAGVQSGSIDLSWFGVAQPFPPPIIPQRHQEAHEGALYMPLAP